MRALTGAFMCHTEKQERVFYNASQFYKGISREVPLSKKKKKSWQRFVGESVVFDGMYHEPSHVAHAPWGIGQ